ncbi:MAG: hypothetical protein PVH54_03265, partial [Gammaproteobacteria bacterium]
YGHGTHAKTQKETIPILMTFPCPSVDSVAVRAILTPASLRTPESDRLKAIIFFYSQDSTSLA